MTKSIDERIHDQLDRLENSALSRQEIEMVQRKIEVLAATREELE